MLIKKIQAQSKRPRFYGPFLRDHLEDSYYCTLVPLNVIFHIIIELYYNIMITPNRASCKEMDRRYNEKA